MKALSLLQPWATLAVLGLKTVETRGWNTSYRGPLLIHAGKSRSGAPFADRDRIRIHVPDFEALPFGALIGAVELADVVRLSQSAWTEDAFLQETLEEFAFGAQHRGRWGFLFEHARAFDTPTPYKGQLGLFEV